MNGFRGEPTAGVERITFDDHRAIEGKPGRTDKFRLFHGCSDNEITGIFNAEQTLKQRILRKRAMFVEKVVTTQVDRLKAEDC